MTGASHNVVVQEEEGSLDLPCQTLLTRTFVAKGLMVL
jgi:hypothetical protein